MKRKKWLGIGLIILVILLGARFELWGGDSSGWSGWNGQVLKVRVLPFLTIKVNGEIVCRMKDPITKYGASFFTLAYAGGAPGIGWGDYSDYSRALLYNTTFTDLWEATISYSANMTLSTYSYTITDNGTALILNLTFTGISKYNVNISAVALRTYTGLNYVNHIVIASNLPSPLALSVNDTIVISWIVVGFYSDPYMKNEIRNWLEILAGVASAINGISGGVGAPPTLQISNGSAVQNSSTLNTLANLSLPGHALIEILGYFDSTPPNPQFLVIRAGGTGDVIFNETVAGLGPDRAVVIKIDVEFG